MFTLLLHLISEKELNEEPVLHLDEPSVEDMKKELTNCIYLQDSSVELFGLKIYGTPWQPEFCGWAFNLPRGQVRIQSIQTRGVILFGK